MLGVTVRSCLEELKCFASAEVVVVDNSDETIWPHVQAAIPTGYIREGKVQLIRQEFPSLFSARQLAIDHAKSDLIACVDGHMIIGKDMFKDLVAFMKRRENDPTIGFAHAPINWVHQHERASKHDRNVTTCEMGDWNRQYDFERTITWKGMPWICRKSWWQEELLGYEVLSDERIGWGGGDIYIGTKPWLLGYKNWAVPTSPAIHIGPFPKVDGKQDYNYRLYKDSGTTPSVVGYLVALYALGGDAALERNAGRMKTAFKWFNQAKWRPYAKEVAESYYQKLLLRQKISFEEYLNNKPWESSND